MLLRAKCKGNTVTALLISEEDAKRYLTAHIPAIHLQLDHLQIECRLPPDFGQGEVEICDWRLCAWLQAKKHSSPSQMLVALTPAGENTFSAKPVFNSSPAKPLQSVNERRDSRHKPKRPAPAA